MNCLIANIRLRPVSVLEEDERRGWLMPNNKAGRARGNAAWWLMVATEAPKFSVNELTIVLIRARVCA